MLIKIHFNKNKFAKQYNIIYIKLNECFLISDEMKMNLKYVSFAARMTANITMYAWIFKNKHILFFYTSISQSINNLSKLSHMVNIVKKGKPSKRNENVKL